MKMRIGAVRIAPPWAGRRPRREDPYRGSISKTDALAALPREDRLDGPRYTPASPRPDRETRPIPELAAAPVAPAAGTGGRSARTVMEQLAAGLRSLDWAALDQAQSAGMTYAAARAARGRTPLCDALIANFRAEVRPVRRHGEAVRRRAEALAYPAYDHAEAADYGAYAAVMADADRITGTRGTGRYRPALPAGGAA